MDKKCYKCKNLFPEEEIRSSGYCKSCHSVYRKEYYNSGKENEYRKRVKDKSNLYSRNYYNANKELLGTKYVLTRKKYYEEHKNEKNAKQKLFRNGNKKYQEYHKDYAKKNRLRINNYANTYIKHRRDTDPEFKILTNIRARLTIALKVRGIRKHSRTKELIGCDIFTLKEHLESKFLPTMNWENHGKYWHIDHVIPCVKFDLSTKEGQKACFHYTNLQPLFAVTTVIDGIEYIGNLNKGCKI